MQMSVEKSEVQRFAYVHPNMWYSGTDTKFGIIRKYVTYIAFILLFVLELYLGPLFRSGVSFNLVSVLFNLVFCLSTARLFGKSYFIFYCLELCNGDMYFRDRLYDHPYN